MQTILPCRPADLTRLTRLLMILAIAPLAARGAPDPDWGSIDLVRDAWGTPHIFAGTDAGALYGLGVATVQDRSFQMTLSLRIMQGRLAECAGDISRVRTSGPGPHTALELDRQMRLFGFVDASRRAVERLDDETRALLEAYCRGINDGFADPDRPVHPAFYALSIAPEPWTPADCLLAWWHLAGFFAKDGLRDHPALEPPPTRARAPAPPPDDAAAVVRREDVSDDWIAAVDAYLAGRDIVPAASEAGPNTPDPSFSHAWVIGGARTTTGSAILVSDPQTPVTNPSLLYEFHMQGETFNARGVGVPGSPVILIGFTPRVAWGMTALGADQADLVLLDTDAEHPEQYRVDGEWLPMTPRIETFFVRDGEPVTRTYYGTEFGPVATEFLRNSPDGRELAVRRIPVADPAPDTVRAGFAMMRAPSAAAFLEALDGWRYPTANCVVGDADGHIGYSSIGALPLRAGPRHDGSIAQDGATRDGLWLDLIPPQLLPRSLDPPRGYLVSANHRSIQSFYPMPFGAGMTGSSGDTDRGLRIKEQIADHLARQDRFTPDDVLAIHRDAVNVWKREVIRLGYLARDLAPDALSPNAGKALAYLHPWWEAGAASDLDRPGTELVDLMSVIFRGNVSELVERYGGGVTGLARFAKDIRSRYAGAHPASLPPEEARFANQVLSAAWQTAARRYGPDHDIWHARAQRAPTPILGYTQGLDGFPSLVPEWDVPAPRLHTTDGGTVLSQRAQSYTQFVPLHDPDTALTILPPGVSDRPASPYRFSAYADWSAGRLRPAPLSRTAVEPLAGSIRSLSAPGEPAPRPARRVAPARTPDPDRPPLPGKRPDDPELESALRFLLRPERTPGEITAEVDRLRTYVSGDEALTRELRLGLELVNHLMREGQAGRIPIRYGTPEALAVLTALEQSLADANTDKTPPPRDSH